MVLCSHNCRVDKVLLLLLLLPGPAACPRLRDDKRKSPDVLSYLKQENAYTAAAMSDTEQLQEELYKEMRARIQEADTSVAVRWAIQLQLSPHKPVLYLASMVFSRSQKYIAL